MHKSKWKKAVWKGYSMIPFMEFMTFGKGKTVVRVKRPVVVSGPWRKERGQLKRISVETKTLTAFMNVSLNLLVLRYLGWKLAYKNKITQTSEQEIVLPFWLALTITSICFIAAFNSFLVIIDGIST